VTLSVIHRTPQDSFGTPQDSTGLHRTPQVVSVEDDTSDLLNTLKTVGGMVMVNILITLITLGIVWYNL
jgi:hypothetical protein